MSSESQVTAVLGTCGCFLPGHLPVLQWASRFSSKIFLLSAAKQPVLRASSPIFLYAFLFPFHLPLLFFLFLYILSLSLSCGTTHPWCSLEDCLSCTCRALRLRRELQGRAVLSWEGREAHRCREGHKNKAVLRIKRNCSLALAAPSGQRGSWRAGTVIAALPGHLPCLASPCSASR